MLFYFYFLIDLISFNHPSFCLIVFHFIHFIVFYYFVSKVIYTDPFKINKATNHFQCYFFLLNELKFLYAFRKLFIIPYLHLLYIRIHLLDLNSRLIFVYRICSLDVSFCIESFHLKNFGMGTYLWGPL